MKLRDILITLTLAVTACLAGGCSSREDEPAREETVLLRLRVRLLTPSGPASRAVGDEYEPDKLPADDGERMHTVRIIIADAAGYVEHNTLWDLTATPDITANGEDFPVKANEDKTIVIIANERNATVTMPDGTTRSAAEYFRTFNAAVGTFADLRELRAITMETAHNASDADAAQLHTPLVSTAIHRYHIGSEPNNSATFTVSRAAVKYEFRFTNSDPKNTHSVRSVSINNIAERQYLFHDADFTDDDQYFWSEYRTPDTSGGEHTWQKRITLAPGGEATTGPIYLPEGHVAGADNPYCVAFRLDGRDSGWLPLRWNIPQDPLHTSLMTDLPRNTFVIVNINIQAPAEATVTYTVCPWEEHETDIPSFN